jgi:cytochrome b
LSEAGDRIETRPVRVWDLPTRACHWAIVALFVTSWATAELDYIKLHITSGLAMLCVLSTRLAWGIVGSEPSRFAALLSRPHAAWRHLRSITVRERDRFAGHNPAGGWMVAVMLLLLAIQVATGLCANDDLVHEGPLAHYLGKTLSDRVTAVHEFTFNLLLAAVALHIGAVLIYRLAKGQDLVGPMLTGRKLLPTSVAAPRIANEAGAAILLALAAIVAWLVSRL